MKKEVKIALYAITIIIIAALLISFYVKNHGNNPVTVNESINSTLSCNADSDCVASSCCHASSCVNINAKPSCAGVFCTLDCRAGSLDCGQGSCSCINGECKAVIK